MYVFDASSIVNLIKRGLARVFEYGVTTNLALYESLNAIWKELELLRRRIDEDVALEYVQIISKVFEAIKITDIKGSEDRVFKLASDEKITIYDATYLYLAIENKAILVTDDSKLKEKAAKYVEVMSSNQLETRILKGE